MKKILIGAALLWLSLPVLAAGTEYQIRADGLACPFCVYGVEKKFKQIKGVEHFDADLKKGLVTVRVAEGVELTEEQVRQLFRDAGFTYRSMTGAPL